MDNTLHYIIRGWSISLLRVSYRLVQYSIQRLIHQQVKFPEKKSLSLVSLSFARQILTGYYKYNANVMHHRCSACYQQSKLHITVVVTGWFESKTLVDDNHIRNLT